MSDATWALTERIQLNVGARWNEDDKEATVFVAQYLGRLPRGRDAVRSDPVPPGFTLLVRAEQLHERAAVSRTYRHASAWTSSSTDDVMAYVSYSQGFKSGGFDMRGNATANPATRDGYDSETADNYEAGIKSTLADGTLQLNATVFYTPYSDVQLTAQQFQIVNGLPTNVTAVLNAGKQLNQGVELESIWRPVSALTLVLNVGYLDAEVRGFPHRLHAAPGQLHGRCQHLQRADQFS